MLHREEKTWTLRITLEADFEVDAEHPAEDLVWLEPFRAQGQHAIVRAAFDALRAAGLQPRVLSRGADPDDEVEILARYEPQPS